jgi:hypothetical protein
VPTRLIAAGDPLPSINRRLDQIIKMQLDEHAARIKKLETAVFSK